MTSLRERNGQSTTLAYDNLNRLVGRNYPATADNVTFSYDLLNRRVASGFAQIEFNSKLMESIRPMFGKEYCGQFEIAKRDASGSVSEIKGTFFLDDVQQLFPLALFTLFPEGSKDVRLRALPQ